MLAMLKIVKAQTQEDRSFRLALLEAKNNLIVENVKASKHGIGHHGWDQGNIIGIVLMQSKRK